MLSFGGFLGMSNLEETLGQTQNVLKRLCISSGLGTTYNTPGGAGKHFWGDGCLD